jgi:hypothetical protein
MNIAIRARKNGSGEKFLAIFITAFKQMPLFGFAIEAMGLVTAPCRYEWTISKIPQMEIGSSFGLGYSFKYDRHQRPCDRYVLSRVYERIQSYSLLVAHFK